MKNHRPYLFILLLLTGCYFPLHDSEYLSEQEQILNSILDESILVSGMVSAFNLEYDQWPLSSKELEKFILMKRLDDNHDQGLIRKCRVFLWKYKELRFDVISREKLYAYYKYEDIVDVSISISLLEAGKGEKYDHVLNLSFETYQVEGSIDEPEVSVNQGISFEDELISEMVIGVIFGLLQGLVQK